METSNIFKDTSLSSIEKLKRVEKNPRFVNYVKEIAEITGLPYEKVKKSKGAVKYKEWLVSLL